MVHIYPFNLFASSECGDRHNRSESQESMDATPNRFSVRRSYDRSVVIDRDTEDIKGSSIMNQDKVAEIQRQTPVVVLSRAKGREKEQEQSGNSICSEHGITFRNMKEFVDGGILELVKEQSFLIYSQETGAGGGHRQVSICAALAVEDCLKGSIKRHEKVTKDFTTQRPLTNSSHPRNVDPVMMMYRHSGAVQAIIDKITARDVPIILQARSRHGSRLGISEDEDGSHVLLPDDHKIWSIRDREDIEALKDAFLGVDSLYIADGHHRTAAACRMTLRNKGKAGLRPPSHTKYLLGFLYPHTHMRVLPYNRCVSTLGNMSPEVFLKLVSSAFRITDHISGRCISRNISASLEESPQSKEVESVIATALTMLTPANPPICFQPLLGPSSESTSNVGPNFPPTTGSPEKSIVRGLVLSMDSDSESDSDDNDTNSEIEDHEDVENIPTRYNRGMTCSSWGSFCSSTERSRSNTDPEKRQRQNAVSLLEKNLDREMDDHFYGVFGSHTCISERDAPIIDSDGDRCTISTCPLRDKGERAVGDRLIGPRLPHIISMYFEGRWLDLSPLEPVEENTGDPLGSLDIQVLFERLLRPLLGIECPRTDHRMTYVCGSEGFVGLESRVNSKAASLAFYVGRVTVADIMRVADAGQLMPPKATCFSPKPLSGLLVRLH